MTMTAAELVASKKHILLDFDGPICAAFAGYGAASISRKLATLIAREGISVPAALFMSRDPFELLRFAAQHENSKLLAEVDIELRRLEVLAVQTALPTPGAEAAVVSLLNLGHTLTIVSNNASEAVRSYLRGRTYVGLDLGISARDVGNPSLLKPNPYLLELALVLQGAQAADAVMIGDSTTDVEASRSLGMASVGLANKPGKLRSLECAGASAVIISMTELHT